MLTRTLKILAVDDNMDNLITVKAVLSEILPNSFVFTAISGREALNIAKNIDPDVILLDIVMPEMDGYETCRLLKADNILQKIPVLFLTALKTDRITRVKALEAGAEGFLSKPIDEIELMAQVQSMAKIKEANVLAQNRNDRLGELVNKRTFEIQKELARRIEAERELVILNENLQKNHDEKLYIIEFQKKLIEMSDSFSVYKLITEAVNEIIGDEYIITSSFDIINNAMDIVAYSGFGDFVEKIINILGFDPRNLSFYISDMNDQERKIFSSGKLEAIDDGIHLLSMRKVPKTICTLLEKILKIKNVYTIGFMLDGKHHGGISILTKSDISKGIENIQILINHAVLALHRIKAEESLRASEEKYKAIFEQSPLGIVLTQSNSKMIYKANQKFTEITGWEINENNQIDWTKITHPDDLEENNDNVTYMKNKNTSGFSMNKRYIKPSGEFVWTNITIAPIKVNNANSSHHICMIEDITDKKDKQERIEYLSYHDTVTDLYNRAYYEEMVNSLNYEKYLPISLITGDINGLKLINDSLGHAVGDKVLVSAAKMLKSNIRARDILARIGGDEFSIILPNTDIKTAQEILERIYKTFETPMTESGGEVELLSISLGCATKVNLMENFNTIEKLAEDHMYKRKLLEHKSFHSSLISSMQATLYEKSNETQEHASRLVSLSIPLGKAVNLQEEQLSELELLSSLHDIGKIGINDLILKKKDKLTDSEWFEMKKHPEIGYRIAISSPELKPIADGILCHHEKWDGSGYPQGLAQEHIPLNSRILSIVDAFDAMTQNRPYRNAMPVHDALAEIERCSGTQFDPKLAKLFIKIINEKLKAQSKV